MTIIRKATYEDIPQIVAMGAAMHAESPRYQALDYSPEKVTGLVVGLLESDSMIVAEDNGILSGMVCFITPEYFFGRDRALFDIVVYLVPEARGCSTFPRLIKACEDEAAARGVRDVQFGVTTGVHAEQTAGALRRMGYGDGGVNLFKRLK